MGDGDLDRLREALTDHRPGGYEDEEAMFAAGVDAVLDLLVPVLAFDGMPTPTDPFRLYRIKEVPQ